MLGIEGFVVADYGVESSGHSRARLSNPPPTFRRLRHFRRPLLAVPGAATRQGNDVVVGGAAHCVTPGIRVIRWPFPASPLPKHASQAQEYEHCERQKNDSVDVEHVSHALGSRYAASVRP